MNPESIPRASALIVAAGSSNRMGFDKLFAELDGVPVLRRSIDAFEACPAIDEIIVVTVPSNFERIKGWKPACPKLSRIVEGGRERHLSVHNGLAALSPESSLVAVHDGARPLISPEMIGLCIDAATAHGAAACARPVTETLKRADPEGFAEGTLDRTHLWAMETPQVVDIKLINSAYEKVLADGLAVTDEVSALQHFGKKVLLVENPHPNIKITYPADLVLAEAILKSR